MKIIFLDFDGVLNSEKYVNSCKHYGVIIDPAKMKLIKKLVDRTGAEIVLTTSWRDHWSPLSDECDETGRRINEIFGEYGLRILDKTPDMNFRREREIEAWLGMHPNVKSYVVFDDMFLDEIGFLNGHFVKTCNTCDGLEEHDIVKAAKILNG